MNNVGTLHFIGLNIFIAYVGINWLTKMLLANGFWKKYTISLANQFLFVESTTNLETNRTHFVLVVHISFLNNL